MNRQDFRAAVRAIAALSAVAILAACGSGTQYSSKRANTSAPAYIPVTPGASPIQPGPAGGNLAVQPGPAVLTEPIAITPGAVPVDTSTVEIFDPSQLIVATSLRPVVSTRRGGSAPAPQAAVTAPRVTRTSPSVYYAKGPIYAACRQAGRKEASDRRCGCVQAVADQKLTATQQKRGAGYFSNQQGLQDTRQSDNAANERFWKAWKAFGQSAGQLCKSS